MKNQALMILIIAMLVISCSSISTQTHHRSIAQFDGEKTIVVLDHAGGIHACESQENKITDQSATFVYYDNTSLLVILNDRIHLSLKDNCAAGEILLNRFDQVLRMLTHEDSGLWLHTLHGHVFRFDGQQLRKVEFNFPVSSFEFDGELIRLYHSNKQGRFCDFDTLSLPMGMRSSSCGYIEAEYSWKDL